MPETLEALKQVGTAAKNEGVKSMEVDKWHAAGFKGKGVKVAVIDSGFKYYKDLKGTFLPADFEPVDISEQLGDTPRAEYEVHGTGTAEIVYSLAPEATLIPIAMSGDDFQLTKAIDYAVSQNVQIVSMSVRRNVTAGDGSGPIDKKIERLRAEKGIMFIASAGNEANAHYGGIFNPDAQGFHQFLPGVTRLAVSLPKYSAPYTTPIVLNWEEWYAKDKTDLDLFAESADGKPLWSSTIDQRARDPLEWVSARFQPGDLIYLRIRQKQGTTAPKTPPRLHLFTYRLQFQYYVPQLSVGDPASSKGVLAVGAVEYADDTLAYYSSNGPLVNGTFKPEISGPTDVSSAAFQEDGVATFGGTSASCPEVSGLAVVFKGANPSLTPDQLTQVMLERSKDLGPPGPDVGYGVGRANAGAVPGAGGLLRPQATPAPTPTLNLSPDLKVQIYQGYPTPKISPVATTTVAKTSSPTPRPTSAPSPTPVPPTATPIPLPTAQPLVADFRDDFKSSQSGLPNSGLSAYQDGQYSVKADPAQMTWSVYPASAVQVENFAAEVTVQGVGAKGLYGLVFWHQDDKNYYLLSLTGDGLAQISRFNNGAWEEIMPWLKITNWQSSGSNLVRLVASEGNLQAFVNNRALRLQPLKGAGTGALGFAAGSYGSAVEAIFTDFRLSFSVNQ
jgi:subtilisin family serine protease